MERDFLHECYEGKEARLKQLNQIDIEMMLLKSQMNKLDRQTRKLINMDPDYKRYIEKCNKDDEYSGNLDYDKYCSLLKLLLESSPESEFYSKLAELLKIHNSVSKTIDGTFDRGLWLKIMEALITKIPEKEFNTWMRGVYPISCEDNIIKLSVDNVMRKYILENEYETEILIAIKEVTGHVYGIEYVTDNNK